MEKEKIDLANLFTKGNYILREYKIKQKRKGDKDIQKYSFPN